MAKELLVQRFFGHAFGQRPAQAGRFGALEVIPNGAHRQMAAARDFPQGELVLMFEPEDFLEVTHG